MLPIVFLVLNAQPAKAQPALIELYTSEGCSSCPPADLLLDQVTHGSVLGLSLHVDYWNDLGWVDPFSTHVPATARQREYAVLSARRTYTPQVVVDGRYDCLGSDRDCIQRALDKAAEKDVLDVRCNKSGVEVKASAPRKENRLTVAWAKKHASSRVVRGENKGQTLEHAWVAEQLETVLQWTGARVEWKATPADRVIAFVQDSALNVVALGYCDRAGP